MTFVNSPLDRHISNFCVICVRVFVCVCDVCVMCVGVCWKHWCVICVCMYVCVCAICAKKKQSKQQI